MTEGEGQLNPIDNRDYWCAGLKLVHKAPQLSVWGANLSMTIITFRGSPHYSGYSVVGK